MFPYDNILSHDNELFPFDDFSSYPRLMFVDWKEEEPRILQAFFKAAALPADGTRLEMDDATQYYQLIHGDKSAEVPWGDDISAQHSMLVALQKVFGTTRSIRYLNHAASGDTGYFLVETNETWQELEKNNPHVRWFFTPVELLPDTFTTDVEVLSQVGGKYARDA